MSARRPPARPGAAADALHISDDSDDDLGYSGLRMRKAVASSGSGAGAAGTAVAGGSASRSSASALASSSQRQGAARPAPPMPRLSAGSSSSAPRQNVSSSRVQPAHARSSLPSASASGSQQTQTRAPAPAPLRIGRLPSDGARVAPSSSSPLSSAPPPSSLRHTSSLTSLSSSQRSQQGGAGSSSRAGTASNSANRTMTSTSASAKTISRMDSSSSPRAGASTSRTQMADVKPSSSSLSFAQRWQQKKTTGSSSSPFASVSPPSKATIAARQQPGTLAAAFERAKQRELAIKQAKFGTRPISISSNSSAGSNSSAHSSSSGGFTIVDVRKGSAASPQAGAAAPTQAKGKAPAPQHSKPLPARSNAMGAPLSSAARGTAAAPARTSASAKPAAPARPSASASGSGSASATTAAPVRASASAAAPARTSAVPAPGRTRAMTPTQRALEAANEATLAQEEPSLSPKKSALTSRATSAASARPTSPLRPIQRVPQASPSSSHASQPASSAHYSTARSVLDRPKPKAAEKSPDESVGDSSTASWASTASNAVKGIFSRLSLSPQKRDKSAAAPAAPAAAPLREWPASQPERSSRVSTAPPRASTPPPLMSPPARRLGVGTPHSSPSRIHISPARPLSLSQGSASGGRLPSSSPRRPTSSALVAGTLVLKKRRTNDLLSGDASWVSTSERAADEVEHISSPPRPSPLLLRAADAERDADGDALMDEEEIYRPKTDRFGNPLERPPSPKKPKAVSPRRASQTKVKTTLPLRSQPTRGKRSRPGDSEEEEDSEAEEPSSELSPLSDSEPRRSQPRRAARAPAKATRTSKRRLSPVDEDEASSLSEDESMKAPSEAGSAGKAGAESDSDSDDFMAMIRKKAAAKIAARKEAGEAPMLGEPIAPEDAGATTARGTRVRGSALEAQKGLKSSSSYVPLDKKPELLASRLGDARTSPEKRPSKPKNAFLAKLLSKRQNDRDSGLTAADLEEVMAEAKAGEALKAVEMGGFLSEEEQEDDLSSEAESDVYDSWDDMRGASDSESSTSYETSPNKKLAASSPTSKGAADVSGYRDVINEMAEDAEKAAESSPKRRGRPRKSNATDTIDQSVDVVDIVQEDLAQGVRQQDADATARQLRKEAAFWLQEHLAAPSVPLETPWDATGDKVLDALARASKTPSSLKALFEAGIPQARLGQALRSEQAKDKITPVFEWLTDLAIFSPVHRHALRTIQAVLVGADKDTAVCAFSGSTERIVYALAMLGMRHEAIEPLQIGARKLPQPVRLNGTHGTTTPSKDASASMRSTARLEDGEQAMKRSLRIEYTNRVLDVADCLSRLRADQVGPPEHFKPHDQSRLMGVLYRLGLDPIEGHQSRCRAIVLRLLGGPTVPSIAPTPEVGWKSWMWYPVDGDALRVMERPPTHARYFLEAFPVESIAARQMARQFAMTYMLKSDYPEDHESDSYGQSAPLADILSKIQPQDSSNEFSVRPDTDYIELEAMPIIVLYALSDFALQMCGPPTKADASEDAADLSTASVAPARNTNVRTPAGQVLVPFTAGTDNLLRHDRERLALLEQIDRRLRDCSNRIPNSKGELTRSRAREMLDRISLAMRYMHSLYGNRHRSDNKNYTTAEPTLHDFFGKKA